MMHRRNGLDGSGEGWSIGSFFPDGPGWMSAAFSRTFRSFACLPLALAFAVIVAVPSARAVDASAEKASLSLAAKAERAMQRGDFLAAQKLYETAIVANPASASAYTGLGAAHQARDEMKFARKYYRIALSIDPSAPRALSRLAHLDLETGNREAAEAGLRKLRVFCPACIETLELARALGQGAANTAPPSTDP